MTKHIELTNPSKKPITQMTYVVDNAAVVVVAICFFWLLYLFAIWLYLPLMLLLVAHVVMVLYGQSG